MKILVAADLSHRSALALGRACRLADEHRAHLVVAHAIDDEQPTELAAHAASHGREALEAMLARAPADGAAGREVRIVRGRPKEAMAALAHELQAELVVVGAPSAPRRGLFGFQSKTLGHILQRTPAPVLVVCRETRESYRSGVVGVDFSVYSRPAIRVARTLAPRARLVLAHAFQVPFRSQLGGDDYAAEMSYVERMEFDRFLADEMEWLEKRALASGVALEGIEKQLVEGEPEEALRGLVEREGSDFLAVGTHGRVGLKRAILGSVATALVNNPPTDVVVVRAL